MIFRIDLKIFAFLIFFYFTNQIKVYGIIMTFVCIHELSHLIIGLLLQMKVKQVTLMPIGLSIEFSLTKKDYNKKILKSNMLEIKKIIVAMAGPISNIIIILIIGLANVTGDFATIIIYSNILIVIFNLLPIYPLDGGRILKSTLSLLINKKNANIVINKISNILLFFVTFLFSILIYYLKNIALLFILFYLWYINSRQNKIYKTKNKMYNILRLNEKSITR